MLFGCSGHMQFNFHRCCVNIKLYPQKVKEEVTSPKTTKRVRESPAQETVKVTPKRPKTQVRAFSAAGLLSVGCCVHQCQNPGSV